jgi:hypothetical protein
MNDELVPTSADLAAQQLGKSLAKKSLADLVRARKQRSLLLVDASGSMSSVVKSGERKIDALRTVVKTLRETHPVPVAAFGCCGRQTIMVDVVPEPSGGTPLAEAIDFGKVKGANHLVVVTDGYPDNAYSAFEAADRFGGKIDVFYIGDGGDSGARFA